MKRILNVLLSAALIYAFTGGLSEGYAQTVGALLKNGDDAAKIGRLADAITHYKSASAAEPTNLKVAYKYGKALLSFGDYPEALKNIALVYNAKPELEDDLPILYARALQLNLKFEAAIIAFQSLKAKYPVTSAEYRAIDRHIHDCKTGKEFVAKPTTAVVQNAGPEINSPFSDFAPVLTTDGLQLYFTSSRTDKVADNAKALPYTEDIFASIRGADGKWTPAKNLGPPVNTEELDASIGLSTDGARLYLYRSVDTQGDLFFADLKGEAFSPPVALPESINTPFWEPSVCESAGGRTLIYVSEKPGGMGGRDLYATRMDKAGKWLPGMLLPPPLNSPLDEDAPFFHPDGRTLYFSSNGRPGMGGFDVYKTVMQDDGEWSKPENLGYPINSPADELYFFLCADKQTAYFSSVRPGGHGLNDVYMAQFPTPVLPEVATATTIETKSEANNFVYLLKGTVRDIKTGKPLVADVTLLVNEAGDSVVKRKSNSATGAFLCTVTPGADYALSVTAPGYLFFSERIVAPDSGGFKEFVHDVRLQPLEPGGKITLKNVFFDFDKATLRKASENELNKVAKLLGESPNLKARINGHTDNRGGPAYNLKLSEERAQTVMNFLVSAGIAKERLSALGFGETAPVESNEKESGRAANRRTELEIVK